MAELLSRLPKAKELFGKLERQIQVPRPGALPGWLKPHRVRWNGRRWRCLACERYFDSKSL
eukprot:5698210-Pyramimonas_sp.AAC.1